jgi:hypothetical protein
MGGLAAPCRASILSVLLVALAACAAAPAQVVERDQVSRIRVVGVISAIGDTFRMSEIGFTVFQNRISDTAIPEWKIDEEAASTASNVLQRKGAYQVVSVATDRRADVWNAHRPTGSSPINLEAIQAIVRSARPEKNLDAFIVLGPVRAREPCDHRGAHTVEGIGMCAGPLMQISGPFPGDPPRDVEGPYGNRFLMPFAFYRVSVLRASDVTLLGTKTAILPRPNRNALDVPVKRIHASVYKESFQQFTEEDRRVIRKAISELLEASIPHTLRGMGFDVDCCDSN